MDKVKLKITRGTVIGKDIHAVADEVVEVDVDTATNLRQAGAAILADKDAKVGKAQSNKVSDDHE
ncbi:hypothetical protein ACFSJQ_17735 [Vibrio olivae]